MSPRRFPSPAPSTVQFPEPAPRMAVVNPEVVSRSPRVSSAASQRGMSPKNRPVTLSIFSSSFYIFDDFNASLVKEKRNELNSQVERDEELLNWLFLYTVCNNHMH